MPKRKKILKAVKSKAGLSKELQEEFDHFFSCFPPKYLNRNLRNMIIDLMECNDGTSPNYLHELLMHLSLFFPVLDRAEEDERYHSKDYDRNRENY
jgi:hypothetical protein